MLHMLSTLRFNALKNFMIFSALTWSFSLVLLVRAFDATPRWGQAVALLNDHSLFIYGGKTDQFNSYSYTSAPNTNDLLYLPLTNAFSTTSPPWSLVNSSSLPGPLLAWHTLSPSNPSNVLLFGGDPDPNSVTDVVSIANSAQLLDLGSPLQPMWSLEPTSWAGEPVRRMRHSTATSSSGRVFIIGGEMTDGSGIAFSDHYVFNPTVPSFALLPPKGPPDIYGHASVILSDGRLLVFGGYSSSQGTLLPFTMVWMLDTSQSNLAWTVIQTSTSSFPSPRIAFAAVSIDDGGILIHGGSDAHLQTNFADGWILNTSTMFWTQLAVLSQLGARRDHFAVCQGDQVLFGFGYDNNGPAPSALQIFNTSSQSFVSLFEPLPPTQLKPTSSYTGESTNGATSRPPSSTSTAAPNPSTSSDGGSSTKMRTVAVGATLGALAVLALLLSSAYYLRRRQHRQGNVRFMALEGGERGGGADSLHFDGEIPVVSTRGDTHAGNRGLLSSLGLVGAISAATNMTNVKNTYQRRDMLADEDTRSFGEWYGRDGSRGSSWSLSLKSILGGGTRLMSREESTTSRGTNSGSRNTQWREKSDPFADGTSSLLHDEDTGFMGVASGPTRPRASGRRLMSHTSSTSAVGYTDPFSSVQDERRQRSDASDPEENGDSLRLSVRHVSAFPTTAFPTTLPLSQGGHILSPLSRHTSQHTSTVPECSTVTSSQANSNETAITGCSSFDTSRTSVDPIRTIDNDIRRTDSWWTRFARTTLLDRRLSDASSRMSGTSGRFEIRDPKPPPRLDAIAETIHLVSKTEGPRTSQGPLPHQQQGPILGGVASVVYNTGHGKSMSSLRTVDSEAIERMAGTMDVFQRVNTRSSGYQTTGSRRTTGSTGGMSIDTLGSSLNIGHDSRVNEGATTQRDNLLTVSSPIQISPLRAHDANGFSPRPSPPPPLSVPSSPKDGSIRLIGSPPPLQSKSIILMPSSSPSVTDRILAFERRMSVDQTPSSPTKKKRVAVDYGLIPRASLFVANPDSHRLSTSGDS